MGQVPSGQRPAAHFSAGGSSTVPQSPLPGLFFLLVLHLLWPGRHQDSEEGKSRSFRNHLFGEGYTVSVSGAQKVEDLMLMNHWHCRGQGRSHHMYLKVQGAPLTLDSSSVNSARALLAPPMSLYRIYRLEKLPAPGHTWISGEHPPQLLPAPSGTSEQCTVCTTQQGSPD